MGLITIRGTNIKTLRRHGRSTMDILRSIEMRFRRLHDNFGCVQVTAARYEWDRHGNPILRIFTRRTSRSGTRRPA